MNGDNKFFYGVIGFVRYDTGMIQNEKLLQENPTTDNQPDSLSDD